jgi:hypothetical protein
VVRYGDGVSIHFKTPVEIYAGSDAGFPYRSFKPIVLKIGSTLYLACTSDPPYYTVFFSKSTDGGATWTPCSSFTFVTEVWVLGFDGLDNAYFVDEADASISTPSPMEIRKYTFSTDTWSLVSDTGPVPSYLPESTSETYSKVAKFITVFSDGTLGIVFENAAAEFETWFDYFTYDGSWSDAVPELEPTRAEYFVTGTTLRPCLTSSGHVQYFGGYIVTGSRNLSSWTIDKTGAYIANSPCPVAPSGGQVGGTVAFGGSLAALVSGETFGGYNTVYSIVSTDGGATWTLKGSTTLAETQHGEDILGWLTSDGTNLYWCIPSASSALIYVLVSSDGGATWTTQTLDVSGTGLSLIVGGPSFVPGVGLFVTGNDGSTSSIWFAPIAPAAFGNEFR